MFPISYLVLRFVIRRESLGLPGETGDSEVSGLLECAVALAHAIRDLSPLGDERGSRGFAVPHLMDHRLLQGYGSRAGGA